MHGICQDDPHCSLENRSVFCHQNIGNLNAIYGTPSRNQSSILVELYCSIIRRKTGKSIAIHCSDRVVSIMHWLNSVIAGVRLDLMRKVVLALCIVNLLLPGFRSQLSAEEKNSADGPSENSESITGSPVQAQNSPNHSKSPNQSKEAASSDQSIQEEDPELYKAKQKARASLEKFWLALENVKEGEDSFMIKVRIQDPYGAEDFWCGKIQKSAEEIRCTIANEPKEVQSVSFGQSIVVEQAQIVDWMFRRNGYIHGNFTMRVLIERMPPEKADYYRSMLAPEQDVQDQN